MDNVETAVVTPFIYQVGHPAWVANLIEAIQTDHKYADRDVTLLAEHAVEAKRNRIWIYAFEQEPKTWERFCSDRIGLPPDYIDAIIVGVDALKNLGYDGEISADLAERVARRANMAEPIREHGGDRRANGSQGQADNYQLNDTDYGTSADYLTRRIARDEPEILERMKRGEFRSVRQAAIEAGIIKSKPRITIAIDPELAAAQIQRHFSVTQIRRLIELLSQ